MKMLSKVLAWLRSALAEADGTPSSSRLLTLVLAIFSSAIIAAIVWHVTSLHDANRVTLYLANLPAIIVALTGFSSAPYAANRASHVLDGRKVPTIPTNNEDPDAQQS